MGYIKDIGENGIFLDPVADRVEIICNKCGAVFSDNGGRLQDSSEFFYDDVVIEGISCPKCGYDSMKLHQYISMRLAIPGESFDEQKEKYDNIIEDDSEEENEEEAEDVDNVLDEA